MFAALGAITLMGTADIVIGIVAGMVLGEFWSARLDSLVSGLIACHAIIQWCLREPAA